MNHQFIHFLTADFLLEILKARICIGMLDAKSLKDNFHDFILDIVSRDPIE